MADQVPMSTWSAAFSALAALLAGGALASVGDVASTLGAHGERLEQAVRERTVIAERFDEMGGRFDALSAQLRGLDRSITAQQANVHAVLEALGVIPADWPPIETVVIGQDIYMFPKGPEHARLLTARGFELTTIGDTSLSGYRVGPIDLVVPDGG